MKKPQIRLAGFDNEWEQKTFGNLGYSYSGLTGKGKNDFGHGEAQYITFLNVLTNSHIKPDMFQSVDVKSGENQNSVVKGDLLFNTSSETPEEVGMCSVLDFDIPNLYLNSFCFGFRLTDESVLPSYMVYQMRSGAGRKLMKLLAQGATRHNLPKKELYKSLIAIPQTTEEQLSIANFFKRLEDLIEINRNKIESLKQLKSASLVSMFPQSGETKPRVRFKGFEGDWEQVSFKDITHLSGVKNKDNLDLESYSISNEKGFVPQKEQFENGGTMAQANKRMYYVVSPDSFAYNPARINVGSIGYYSLNKDVIVSSLYVVFKTDDNTYNPFLNYWFKTPMFNHLIEMYQEGGVRLYFFYDKLCKCSFRRPSKKEQMKIASFFSKLDKQISTQEQRLEKLKQIKSACLNKMFV